MKIPRENGQILILKNSLKNRRTFLLLKFGWPVSVLVFKFIMRIVGLAKYNKNYARIFSVDGHYISGPVKFAIVLLC